MKRLIYFILGALLSVVSMLSVAAEKTMIILDGSGSMWAQIDGQPKLKIAQKALGQLLDELPSEMELGFMAYGHREKGNCDDIELLVEPAQGTQQEILEKANAMRFLGMTPLTASVEQAAEHLKFTEEKSTIILITDGLETCRRDPCATAKELADKGIDFTAHVIGFDLTDEQGEQVACLATQTGGEYFKASNATELASAMQKTVSAVEQPKEKKEVKEEPEEKQVEQPLISLEGPNEVAAGAKFEIQWAGEGAKYDYLMIVEKGAPDNAKGNSSRIRLDEQVVELTAPDAIGQYEVRYIQNETKDVLASHDITLVPVEASLDADDEVAAGAKFDVQWTGPANQYDYLIIVEKGAPENAKGNSTRVNSDSDTVTLTAPDAVGQYELRYIINQSKRVLASRDIALVPVEASLDANEEVAAGAKFDVQWTGPANQYDYLIIVEKGAPENTKGNSTRVNSDSDTVTLTAPDAVGQYELRYIINQSKRVLASRDITLVPVEANLKLLNTAVPEGTLEIEWSGPANQYDFITLVEKGAPDKITGPNVRVRQGTNTVTLKAPKAIGQFELRYIINQSKRVLTSLSITIKPVELSVSAPETVQAGKAFEVEWTGPANWEDFIEIVPADDPDGKAASETRTSQGSPLSIFAPGVAGEYVIRYHMRDSKETGGERKLKVE